MKKSKLLIPVLATLMCVSVGAGFAAFQSVDASPIAVKAEDGGLVIGDNTISVTEEDIAGEGAVISMFTVETAGYYTFSSSDLIITVADELGNIIDDTVEEGICSPELAVGTYLIVFVPTSGAAGDYVATIMEGIPAAEPTVYDAGQMYSHEAGIGNNSDEFAFYFRTDANDAVYADDWSKEYGATTVDNIKLTRNGETTSVAVIGQGAIVRINETDHYMKFAAWTTSGVLPVQEGDVFTISGVFQCTNDETQQINITETTVTYRDGALKYSTDPVVHNAGQMYAHEAGVNPNENGGGASGFAFYFKTDANDAAYNDNWACEYGATAADNIKLTRNGETTSVAVLGQGTIVKYGETDHYMKFVPWTTSGVLPVQDGDVFTISGVFVCTSDTMQRFRIAETVVAYRNGELKYLTPSYTFVDEDGTVLKETGVLAYGSVGEAPVSPTKASDAAYTYTFDNWYVGDEVFDPAKAYEGSVVVMAKYTATVKPYTVTVKQDGQEDKTFTFGVEAADGIVAASDVAAELAKYLPAATAELEYAFAEEIPETFALQDYTFNVTSTVRKYTVTVRLGGNPMDTSNVYTVTKKYGETLTLEDPTAEGKTFAKWTDVEGNEITDWTVTGATAVYATWNVTAYKVTVKQAGKADQTFTFGVETADGIDCTVDAVAYALSTYLPEDTDEFKYAWAEVIPETFELKDYTFTIEETAVEVPNEGTDDGDEPTEEPKEEPTDSTSEPTEEPAPADEGCGSVVGGVALGAMALAGAAMFIRKKKED